MTWLSSHSVDIAGARVTVASLLLALAVVLVGFVVASLLAKRVRGTKDSHEHRWRGTVAQVVGYGVRLAAITVALQIAGVDIGSVLAAGAVVAVGIGFAMQKVAENFVSGVILLAERSIREGDIIDFDGRIARVRHMGIRATVVETLDDEEIIVPNSILAQSAIKNLTLTEPLYRLRVRVGVAYSSDLAMVEELLRSTARAVAWREPSREPVILLADFASSSVDFEVCVWTQDVWALRRSQSELRKAIWRALQEAKVVIPFPQLDVTLVQAAAGAPKDSKREPT